MLKYCSGCKQEKDTSEFGKHVSRFDGLQSICKACQTDYGKARYQLTKEAYAKRNKALRVRNQNAVYEYLKTKCCVDCGVTDPRVLTFDHFRDKRMEVSEMVKQSYGLETIFNEIGKCHIRCFNCHMIKDSAKRNGKKWSGITSSQATAQG